MTLLSDFKELMSSFRDSTVLVFFSKLTVMFSSLNAFSFDI